MADEQSILAGEPVTLKQTIVGHWDGDGSYSDIVKAYGSTELSLNVTTVSAQRVGDGGQLLATLARITGGTASLTFAGDLTTLGVMLGIDPETLGSDPNQIRAFRLYNRNLPYFGLIASADLDSGDINAVHVFAPKCQVNAESIQIISWGGGAEAEFRTVTVEISVLSDENYIEEAADEVQSLAFTGTATAGTYTITVGNQTTAAIAYNADAAAVELALEALSVVGTGNVVVTGTLPTYTITFAERLAESKLPLLTVEDAALTDATATITRTTAGAEGIALIASVYEVEAGWSPTLPPLYDI
jgi:hypothetical protein